MSNDDSVAGFQFTLDFNPNIGDVVSVSTTNRTEGFNVSTNNGIVVGFSLTGDVIAPGDGPIVSVTVVGSSTGTAAACLSDVVISDPAGQAMNPTATCGTLSVTEDPVDPIVLNVGSGAAALGSSSMIELSMDNNEPVGGFQFTFNFNSAIVSIGNITTTERTEGFTVSSANGIVVGFSLTGDVISVGSGPILNVEMVSASGGSTDVCLNSIVISDPTGNALPSDSECGVFTVTTDPVDGCTDMSACNYNSSATNDDGSCEYPEENFDCDGNCTADIDCNGDCAGSAELDQCGVCDGDDSSCSGCTDSEALNYDENATIDDGSCSYVELSYFTDLPDETGESSLVIIQNAMGLEPGDEIGLFDAMGVLESVEAGGIPEYGHTLVGAGVYTGDNQLEIVGIQSVDLSDFGGPVLLSLIHI